MNILTKICVVLIALLSVAASVVFSRKVFIDTNYRHAYETESNRSKLANMSARQHMAAVSSANSRIGDLENENKRSQEQIDQQGNAHNAAIARLRDELGRAQDTNASHATNISALQKDLKQLQDRLKHVSDMLTGQLEENDRQQREIVAVERSLSDSQAETKRLEGIIRVLREVIVARDDDIKQLRQKLAAAGASAEEADGAAEAVATSARITGTLTAVDGELASINIGSVKGITKGMELFIYRGGDFVAKLRITDVDDNESAGIVFSSRRGMTPKPGDKVTTSLKE